MAALRILAFLASLGEGRQPKPAGIPLLVPLSLSCVIDRFFPRLPPAALCRGQNSDCSYLTLLDHLNLSSSQTMLTAMRPVRDWRTNTTVKIDLLLYGILQVVRND